MTERIWSAVDMMAVVAIAEQAGSIVMSVYERPLVVEHKGDDSPLTEADLRSHEHIVTALRAAYPDIPVLSEESSPADAEARMTWREYWLIDPLDGTKEFIKRNGEFTVNIALVRDGMPVAGVVHAPALGLTYWGEQGAGAYKREAGAEARAIQVAQPPCEPGEWRVVGSRSHASPEFEQFMRSLPDSRLVSMGSSLKLCLVAEGAADLYPRLGPTSEWDTAAAQAVVEAAGGHVLTYPTLRPMRCNQNPASLLNPHFIVCARPHRYWSGGPLYGDDISYERRRHDSKSDVVWLNTQVTAAMRSANLSQVPRCIWLTGLSGAGKSTIANALELALHAVGRHTYLLDGDNVRHGLCRDLGMTDADRSENIRRVGELARLMVDAGLIVVTAFISPFRADRDRVRALFPPGQFVEVHVHAPLAECERRDPKGLYRKAREGVISHFTGIDSPYEEPEVAELTVNTHELSRIECISAIMRYINESTT
ncbi:UNVERIFIED_CONTAM: cysC [Trichonephila clavipes]